MEKTGDRGRVGRHCHPDLQAFTILVQQRKEKGSPFQHLYIKVSGKDLASFTCPCFIGQAWGEVSNGCYYDWHLHQDHREEKMLLPEDGVFSGQTKMKRIKKGWLQSLIYLIYNNKEIETQRS